MHTPKIIQGGMGVAVSGPRLARAVGRTGQLGVVSGTALDVVLARRLQLGDPDGELREALDHFPVPEVAERVRERYFVDGGIGPSESFRPTPMAALRPSRASLELTVVANFVEVWLARRGHDAPVGINYLRKIQLPLAPALYGALLGGVGFVLVGAGIPSDVPDLLDRLTSHLPVEPSIDVEGATRGEFVARFDPADIGTSALPPLERPRFLPIVSSHTLATMLVRRTRGRIDGFVVESPTAGGHNAPPRGRGAGRIDAPPVYGPRDRPDPAVFRDLGLPFWLAGGRATPGSLRDALTVGAAGVQLGTAFAFCRESGVSTELRRRMLQAARKGTLDVRTDARASPTGFPFKVVELAGTIGDAATRRARRTCDLGFLRHAVRDDRARAVWRCPAEPVAMYVAKGGAVEDTIGQVCVCNGLTATVGLGARDDRGAAEPPLVTCGDDLGALTRFLRPGADDYSARDVVDGVLGLST